MRGQRNIGVSVCVVASLAGGAMALAEGPAIFGTRTVAEAIEAGKKSGKLVVLDATATWCAPCKSMDATTWIEPSVETWLKNNAIAAQFDVDKDAESARTFNIAGMPTIIAIKGGTEFDRVMGYKSAEQLLGWLQGVQQGKTEAQQQAAPDLPLKERFRLAREKVMADRAAEAYADYMWLWEHLDKTYPEEREQKIDGLVFCLRDIWHRLPEKKATFEKMRDELAGKASTDAGAARDYLALCRIVDDTPAVLKWFEDNRVKPGFGEMWKACGAQVEPALVQQSRWKDIGVLLDKPSERLRAVWERTQKNVARFTEEGRMDEVIVAEQSRYRAEATRLYVALLAADRDEEAAVLADEATKTDPSPFTRGSLLTKALDADQGRQTHLTWLEPRIGGVLDLDDAKRRILEQSAKRQKK